MKKIIYQIHKIKEVPFNISIENMRKYPVHYQIFYEIEKSILAFTYDPSNRLNEGEYSKFIQNMLVTKYSTPTYKAKVEILENQDYN